MIGIDERWNMPVVMHSMTITPDMLFAGVDHFILTYHLGGDRVRRIDRPDLTNIADRGALSLQLPGSSGRFECLSGQPVAYAHLYFQQSLLDEVAEANAPAAPAAAVEFFGVTALGCEMDVEDYVRRALRDDERPVALEMDSRAYLIGLGLVRSWGAASANLTKTASGRLDPRRMRRVVDLIEERIGDHIRLADLAEAAALSPFHFARQFKAATGETPAAYVTRRRVERAEDLLRHTRLTIPEIAYKLGFAHQSHLHRAFKKRMGATPGSFRRGPIEEKPGPAGARRRLESDG
jgi:AraC family transcriptional regulator